MATARTSPVACALLLMICLAASAAQASTTHDGARLLQLMNCIGGGSVVGGA